MRFLINLLAFVMLIGAYALLDLVLGLDGVKSLAFVFTFLLLFGSLRLLELDAEYAGELRELEKRDDS